MMEVITKHTRALILGTLASVTTFLLFYLMTVFTLSWGTTTLHFSKSSFLFAQIISMLFFALVIPVSAIWADRFSRGTILIWATTGILIFGLFFSPFFALGNFSLTAIFLTVGMILMGITYGPLGTALAEIFPASVRYTGASLSFTFAGILGGSLTPFIATKLAKEYGLSYVGYYLSIAAAITLVALVIARPNMKDAEKS